MNIPNTVTVEQVAKQMGWSATKTKAFIRKNDLPYHAQAGTYYLDANIGDKIWDLLNSPLTKKRRTTKDEAQKTNYKAGITRRNLTLQIKELKAKVADGSATADEKKQLAQLTGEKPARKAEGK